MFSLDGFVSAGVSFNEAGEQNSRVLWFPMKPYVQVSTTCPNRKEAGLIARSLLKEKLAACVQIVPVESLYRWKGKIEQAAEYLLLIKTRTRLFRKVQEKIRNLHSYEVPEIISCQVEEGLPEYLRWLNQETE